MRRKVRIAPRDPHLWAQLGLLAVAAAVSLFAVVALLTALGLSPR